MWKSAIARAKRIGDHGRKTVPIVKVEAGHTFATLNQVADMPSRSFDEDDSNDEVDVGTNTNETPTPAGEHNLQMVGDTQGKAKVVNELVASEPKARRKVDDGKKAAVDARKKLAKARKK